MDCIQKEDGFNGLYVGGGWIKCIVSRKRIDLMDCIQEEDGLLKRFADSTDGREWDSIAKELGTNRTAIACYTRSCIIYIYILCFLFLRLYPINVKTAEPIGSKFLWDLTGPPREGLWMLSITKICEAP